MLRGSGTGKVVRASCGSGHGQDAGAGGTRDDATADGTDLKPAKRVQESFRERRRDTPDLVVVKAGERTTRYFESLPGYAISPSIAAGDVFDSPEERQGYRSERARGGKSRTHPATEV